MSEVYGEEFEDAMEVLRSYWQGNIDESQLVSRISACRDRIRRKIEEEIRIFSHWNGGKNGYGRGNKRTCEMLCMWSESVDKQVYQYNLPEQKSNLEVQYLG